MAKATNISVSIRDITDVRIALEKLNKVIAKKDKIIAKKDKRIVVLESLLLLAYGIK